MILALTSTGKLTTTKAARQHAPRVAGQMNKTEARYANELEIRRRVGEIASYYYEPLKLKLASRASYRPDFRVALPDGCVEYHEVKGARRTKTGRVRPNVTPTAMVKIRVAAALYRDVAFYLVWPADKSFERERIAAS